MPDSAQPDAQKVTVTNTPLPVTVVADRERWQFTYTFARAVHPDDLLKAMQGHGDDGFQGFAVVDTVEGPVVLLQRRLG
jgi:hypothetical protein